MTNKLVTALDNFVYMGTNQKLECAACREVGRMLYVFHVDTGTMLQMDINLALVTVAELKETICRSCHIPVEKQVLLVSGGECLELTARVCTYSAGTDTNPIFLFCKSSLESRSFSPPIDYGSDGEVTKQIEASLELPSTYSTVVTRVSLAQTLCELAKELSRDCERLVHDQHLQQQGWAAAAVNLEDATKCFRERSLAFQKDFRAHLDVREESLAVLENFNDYLETLSKIPILPPLLANALSVVESKTTTMTLLQWILAKGSQSSLQVLAEQCAAFLEQLDAPVLGSLMHNVEEALEIAENLDMTEIKGLSERLCSLEKLMMMAKRTVQEQVDLAQSFQQNQHRASNLGDASILPDLCASHRRQLLVMLENHSKLKDIRRRCQKAKEELSKSLHHRLRWLTYAQNKMKTVGNNLMIYHKSLQNGRRHFSIVRQLQEAPELYCLAVAEVVRRKKFSRAFLKWATDLSNRLLATYNEETERRREFKLQFAGHFLEPLFPGLDGESPDFATKSPEPFDHHLPDLRAEDMETLREILPDVALRVSWTELSSVAQMILSKTQIESKEDSKEGVPVEDRLVAAVSQVGLSDQMDETFLRQDDGEKIRKDRDLESETDTDEFENISPSPKDKRGLVCSLKDSVADVVRQQMAAAVAAGRLAVEVTSSLRAELLELRGQSMADKDDILGLVQQIQLHIVQLTEGYVEQMASLHAQFSTQALDNELEMSRLRQVIEERSKEIMASERLLNVLQLEVDAKLKLAEEERENILSRLNAQIKMKEEEHEVALGRMEDMISQLKSEKEVDINDAVQTTRRECDLRLQQTIDKHEQEVAYFTTKEETLQGSLNEHKGKVAELEEQLVQTKLTAEIELENRVKELEAERSRACNELEARLTRDYNLHLQEVTSDYKTELGSLRSRFRLMSLTSMEKSPSDSSLEKIERGDVIELANHEAILAQTKEDAEIALEKAVEEAVLAEKQRSRLTIEERLLSERARMEEEKQVWLEEAVTRAIAERDRQAQEELRVARSRLEEEQQSLVREAVAHALMEKDKQVENLLARQQALSTECQRHRDTIRLLSEGEHLRTSGRVVDPLIERLENLEKEKKKLFEEVTVLRAKAKKEGTQSRVTSLRTSLHESNLTPMTDKTQDMAQSFAVMSHSVSSVGDAPTSPEFGRMVRDKMTKNVREVNTGGKISLSSCSENDPVLVLWSLEHKQYVILQDNPTLHFLHYDCLDTLGLKLGSDGSPRKLHTTAIVTRKEFCHALKSENRYRVPKGTKFYRVMVKPLPKDGHAASIPSDAS